MAQDKIEPPPPPDPDKVKFGDMDGGEKLVFIGKLFVFLITMGFAFGTLLD